MQCIRWGLDWKIRLSSGRILAGVECDLIGLLAIMHLIIGLCATASLLKVLTHEN